jgi:glutamyl-tRNA reductase
MLDVHRCPHQEHCSALPAHVHFHAVAAFSGLGALRVLTSNHRNVGLERFERLSLRCEAAARLHADLTDSSIESIVVATCNRSEVYWRARVPGDDELVLDAFAKAVGTTEPLPSLSDIVRSGEAAAMHLYRVCCGLESRVVGEAEILGQVRAALEACPGAGGFLDGVFRAALRTGRAARAETAIGSGALSVASAAVRWVGERLPLATSRVLVVGAGDTGHKVAKQLHALGVAELVIANRTLERAHAIAPALDARATGLDALPLEMAAADAVFCAATAPGWLVRAEHMRRASDRRAAPLVVVDLAMPAGVEPVELPGVTRIGMAGLDEIVATHRQQRAVEIPHVDAVIARELDWLRAWARHQALRPLVSDLRRKVEAIRRAELAKAKQELRHADDADAAVLERLSRRLLDQLLAVPLATLEAGDLPLDPTHAEYLRRLFSLEQGAA